MLRSGYVTPNPKVAQHDEVKKRKQENCVSNMSCDFGLVSMHQHVQLLLLLTTLFLKAKSSVIDPDH